MTVRTGSFPQSTVVLLYPGDRTRWIVEETLRTIYVLLPTA